MMDSMTALMFMENLEEDVAAGTPLRTGNISRGGPTGLYHTRDADIILTGASDDQWRRLCGALDASELLEDPRFDSYTSRAQNVAAAREEVQARVSRYTREEMLQKLEEADVPCGPVRTAPEVMADDHFYKRGTLLPMRHGAMKETVSGIASGWPVVFSDGPLPQMAGAPTLGMHNEDIYGKLLNLDPDALEGLRQDGVI
jgi:crotonobetainyl-CoA:carnitine CoA-transferase CaiB-like acyl-CoA transferase